VNEIPSHPEVNQENETAFEPNNQILAAAFQSGHTLPRQLGSHLCRIDGTRQARIGDRDLFEPAANQPRLERRPNGLDLW
jgi:hypothetical protein